MEAGVVVGFEGEPIYWHLPPDRSVAKIPDSRKLWEVLWENRAHVYGFAHSHPGTGLTGPSWEDVTTFSAVEIGLGRRLMWWITSSDSLATVWWAGPGKYDYVTSHVTIPTPADPIWLSELRRHTYQM